MGQSTKNLQKYIYLLINKVIERNTQFSTSIMYLFEGVCVGFIKQVSRGKSSALHHLSSYLSSYPLAYLSIYLTNYLSIYFLSLSEDCGGIRMSMHTSTSHKPIYLHLHNSFFSSKCRKVKSKNKLFSHSLREKFYKERRNRNLHQ